MRSEPSDLRDIGAAVERVLEAGGASFRHAEWWFLCPAHADTRATNCAYHPGKQTWFCQACAAGGGVLDLARRLGLDVGGVVISPEDRAAMEAGRMAIAAEIAESKRRAGLALDAWWSEQRLQARLTGHARALADLAGRGIDQRTAEHLGIGHAVYGLDGRGHSALAIPWTVGGHARAVQYRLLDAGAERYRWHAGSNPTLYNADAVVAPHDDTMIVVEGALKAACLVAHGITSVAAVVNKHGWKPEYAPPFKAFGRVIMALDPDAYAESRAAALTIPGARVAILPGKPDDLLQSMRGDVDAFMAYVGNARKAD